MRVLTAVIKCLQAEGVPFLSAYPTTPLIDAAAREGLRPVICRQERVGVGIADGATRITNGAPPGVFAMQWGPGAENAYSGVATAFADNTPMLLLPLGHPQDRLGVRPFFDGVAAFATVSRHAERITSADQVGAVMRRAFSRLRNGPPGPVVVELPADIVADEISDDAFRYRAVATTRPHGDPASVEAAVDALATATRPVLLAGQGVLYSSASAELVALAERAAIPVATTLQGKSAFPEDHPLSLGTASLTMPGAAYQFLRASDLVVAVGTSLTRHFLSPTLPEGASLVHVTIDPTDIGKDYDPDHAIVGDARAVLRQMAEAWDATAGGRRDRDAVEGAIAAARTEWLDRWAPLLGSDDEPINHYRVVREIGRALEAVDSVVTHDSGSPRDQLVPFYRARRPRSYLGWGKSHGLGTGLGLVMGAKLLRPETIPVHVMGDAAFGMVGLDFETAVREQIPIMAVVLNNSIMAIEERTMRKSHERYGSRSIRGHYADLATAMDGWGRRVDHPSDIAPALAEACDVVREGRAALVEIITAPEQTPFSHKGAAEL